MSVDELRDLIAGLAKLEVRLEAGDRQVTQHIKFLEDDVKELADKVASVLQSGVAFDQQLIKNDQTIKDVSEKVTLNTSAIAAIGKKVDANSQTLAALKNRAIGVGIGMTLAAGGTGAALAKVFGS